MVASLLYFETAGISPRDLDAACFASYVAGLREAGWVGDERLVRRGFTAAAALRYTVGSLRLVWPEVIDPALRPAWEDVFGRPLEEVVEGWTELWTFERGLIEEARALLPTVG